MPTNASFDMGKLNSIISANVLPEKPPKIDKFVRSVTKTLILKSYSRNA